jgi:RimJ/RimL family protein N-acetyltransferase
MKQLMLGHAFLFAKAVWFHIGSDNRRSRRAMEKIGGQLSHEARVEANGVAHDYAFYRIEAPQ